MSEMNTKFKDEKETTKSSTKWSKNKNKDKRSNKDKNKGKDAKVSVKEINDPSWYSPNPQLVKDSASIPYSVFNGVQYELTNTSEVSTMDTNGNTTGSQPGIFVYKYIPFAGQSGKTSALNMAMRALYTYVRHANAGHTNYEAPDLMMYILAVDSIYLMIHEFIRVLKLAYAYNIGNRLIPEKIFQALGLDVADVTSDLANYRARINQIIAKVNTLAVPADFDLFERRSLLGSVILTDEPNRPTQIIIPKSDIYYVYDPTGKTGGQLLGESYYQDIAGAEFKFSTGNVYAAPGWLRKRQHKSMNDWLNTINNCVAILLADEDINIMSGDILKAYGQNIFHLKYVEENSTIEFSHDEDLLTQFANSVVLDVASASLDLSPRNDNVNTGLGFAFVGPNGVPNLTNVPTITQRDGSILCHAVICLNSNAEAYKVTSRPFTLLGKAPIRSFKGDTTPEKTLEYSRLIMLMQEREEGDDLGLGHSLYIQDVLCGTEIGLGWLVYTTELPRNTLSQWFQFAGQSQYFGAQSEGNDVFMASDVGTITSNTEVTISKNLPYIDNAMKGLSFGPLNYPVTKITFIGVRAEFKARFTIYQASEKCALVDGRTLKTMHDVALLGLFKMVYYK